MISRSNAVIKTRLTRLQEFGLFGVFLTVPLFRLGSELLGDQSLSVAKVFVVLTFLLWMANILMNKDTESIIILMREKANILILLFLALTFISLINARYIQEETVSEISQRFKMLTIYVIIIGVIKDRRTFKIALCALIIGSILTTGVGLYELSTGTAFFKESLRFGVGASGRQVEGLIETTYSGATRVQGLYSEPGFHAHSMVIFFGLALPWIFYGSSKRIRLLVGILLIFYLMNLIGTGARVGWISLALSVTVFMFLLEYKYKYALWVISIVVVITIFLALSLIPHIPTLERLHTKGDISLSWRLDTNRQALEMLRDHPLLGVGTGNYLSEYHNYLSESPELSRYFFGPIHNSYAQILVENGTIGLLVFLLFLLTIFFGLLAVYRNAADLEMKALSLGLLTAFTGFAVEFSGVPILGQEPGWIVLGLGVALITIARKEKQENTITFREY